MPRPLVDIHDDYRRPEDAIDFPTDCPICFEVLFDDEGKATRSKGGIAKLMCPHLVHSSCLGDAGKSLNSDGERFGMGGLGQPRCGCPVCNEPVSMWEVYERAEEFPIFWVHRIQNCLETIGSSEGPVPVALVQQMLQDSADEILPRLTPGQKKKIFDTESSAGGADRIGFNGALQDGDSVWVNRVVDGGPSNGGYTVSGFEDGIWDYNKEHKTLWLGKWGEWPPPLSLFRTVILPVLSAIVIGYLCILFAQAQA